MMTVLIVDDSPAARRDLRGALQTEGFDPLLCEAAVEARRAIRDRLFNLYILDVKPGDSHGLDLLQDVRARPGAASRPVIIISAEADISDRLRDLRAGASEAIARPFATEYVVRRAAELTSSRPGQRTRRSAEPGRILVIDDSLTYGAALAEALRKDRHDVVLAASGAVALDYLALQPVDGIVLDVFMPEMSGIEVCRRLRSQTTWADFPVLMLTGRTDSVVKQEAMQVGIDDFAVKSHDLEALRQRVAALLDRPPSSTRPRSSPRAPQGAAPRAPGDLMERVAAASGLSELLARSSIERACERAGVDPKTMTPAELRRVLPHIQRILGLFLPFDQAAARVEAIEALAKEEGSS